MSVEDAVKVCLRVRPLILREQGEQVNLAWKADNNTVSQVDGTRSFNFDRVFHSNETTAQVYQEVAVPIIRSALQGYNGTIFAYGQTSSGKTYTMMGTPNNLGIIPKAVEEVFKIIQEIPSREFLLRVSYMEIYNESVTDLLCDDRKKKPLEVREDFNRTVYVADLTEELVTVPQHVMQWIKKGEKNRHYGETKMNDHSSRSHTIFRMIVESRERNDPGNSENCDGAVMVSHLNLVDLAGSERATQTGAEGVRFKEGCNINRSLFILGQVIKKLSDGQLGGFINYRDSKLTRILQNSLGGNTKTVIICTITPISLEETLSTLQFASTAKHVKNTPHVNEVLDDHALLKRYRKEIMVLKKQLEELEASTDIKTHATAVEEHSLLLSEIKELQKEKENRIRNLGNIVVASSQESTEDQRVKRKRRVTWAFGKRQDNSCFATDFGSKLTANFAKLQKISEFSTIPEIDDSICTESSEFDDTGRVLDDLGVDADWNSSGTVTYRERTALSHSMIDFSSESTSAPIKDTSLQKCKEMEAKVAELECQLKERTKEYEAKVAELECQLKERTKEYEVEVGKRESLEKETADLKQAKSNAEKCVQTLLLEETSVRDQTGAQLEGGEQSPVPGDHLQVPEKPTPLKTDHEQELETLNDSPLSAHIDEACQDPDDEALSYNVHDMCREQIRMLEQKIADLEGSARPENNGQNDLIESLQICEALMAEKQSAHEQLGTMQNDFDYLIAENESLKREIADLEKCLQEKHETNEFEILEKEAQKEHENEVECKSKLLLEQERQIAELKSESEMLQKKVRYYDLMASMGNGEKLCEEVFQMQQSLTDAETVTRDAQGKAAFLRSENLELKEQMDEILIRCEKREKDASDYEKQLEIEKSKYKAMQTDLQKELQYAFNEINQLNSLMVGKVPKELLSRIELEKKVEEYSKQLTSILEENNDLQQKVANLSESLHLRSEVDENLRDQAQRTSEELLLLKSGKEQSACLINDQEHKLQEQSEQIEKLTGEVTQLQVKYQQAEQQYSELKRQHESLQESCSLPAGDLNKRDSEAQCLLLEVACAEQQLSAIPEKKHDLLQAKQEMETLLKELHELLKSSCMENENLQDQVKHLFLKVTTLQQQSELCKEKQDLEEKYNALLSEKEQLQEQLVVSSLTVLQPENAEPSSKLQELQDELNLVVHHRDELLIKMEDLEDEKNNLKQDLNENIELSIETQDELRTTQEELKQQKQLVADLRKQLADYGDASPEAASQKDILEEKLSGMTEKLQENEAKCESLTKEKLELERVHQNLISEMKLLQERMHSAELALSKVGEENTELKQNIKEQPKFWELDEMLNSENLETDPNRQVKQEEDVKGLQLQEISAMLQERDALHETIKILTAERDQLKQDLQENIEMSIDTQEELRSALDDLKAKTQLLESLSAQMKELQVGENGVSNRAALQCEVEEKSKKIEELETKVEDVLGSLQETESKYVKMEETLKLITKEKDNLISSLTAANNNLVNDLAMCKQDKSTQDCALQVSIEMPTNDQVDAETRQEEIESERNQLKETLSHLQLQLNVISQEKGELQQSIDNLKTERCELLNNLQRYTENEALRSEVECDLKNDIEKLKEQLKAVREQQLMAAESEEAADYTDMELNMPEENVMKNPTLLEEMQGENLELLNKLGLLQEELQKETAHKNELQRKLQGMINESACLQENLESVLSCSSRTQEELQRCQEELNHHVRLVSDLRMAASCSTPREDKETITDLVPCLEEEVLGIQENLLLKNPECQQLIKDKEILELERNHLSSQIEGLMEVIKETQSTVVSLQNENLEAEKQILNLQQQIEGIAQERELLKNNQQRGVSEINQESQTEYKDQETEEDNLPDMEAQFASMLNEKSSLEEKLLNLQQHMEMMTNESNELRVTIQSLQSERDQLKQDLRENGQLSIETQDDLRKAQDDIQQEMQRVEELMCKIASLEQKLSSVENQLQETALLLKEANSEREIIELSKQKLLLDLEEVQNEIETQKCALDKSEKEGSEAGQKVLDLAEQLKATSEERNQIQLTNEELKTLSTEIQDELQKAQEEVQQQKQRVEELTNEMSLLEEKSSSLERELQEKIHLLDKAAEDRHVFEQSIQNLTTELQQVMEALKSKDIGVEEAEKEKAAASQKILELSAEMESITQERDDLQISRQKLEEESTEIQDELQKAQEEVQQQKQRVEELTNEMSLLEEKSSSLERELQEKIHLLDKAAEDRHVFEQSIQNLTTELQQVMEALKSKDIGVEEAEKEKAAASQKILELSAEMESITQERDDLQNSRQKLEEEAEKLKEEIQQLRHERNLLTDEQVRKTRQLNELEAELQQLQDNKRLSETSTKQLQTDHIALLKQLQQCELDVASLRQEHEQFQQLLQRARSEKENIYVSLQEQEKAVAQVQDELITSQAKLQTVMTERDESNMHLLEKVNEVKERLQEISSLQEQIQQLHQEVKAEKLKNLDLLENVDLLEKEITVLRLIQNEPEEVDELAERTETLEEKNQEWKDLMVKIDTVYSDHHSSLNNISCELQSMTQTENQSMGAIKESLSSTFSRTFGNLQAEHIKLNSQVQMLLNKFKVIYRHAAVQKEHYSSVKDSENELCVLQKKNDQLLLQCQSLEQCGSKWSETAAEELKFCEIEFMNQLLFKKIEVIKNIEDGFSEIQVCLNSVENELQQELKYKKEFIEWLREFQGLHFDTKKLNDGVLQENRRIAAVFQNFSKKLKIIAQSKTKQDTMRYLNTLETDLQEKKEKNKDLLQRMAKISPSGDSSMLEEENARLRESLKNVQGELKKLQCRIQDLEKQLSAVEADAKQKELRASLLEDKLRSNVAEVELSEMQVKVNEKEKLLQAAHKETQILQEKISKGAAPYKDEIESLKSQVVWLEMDRVKSSKSSEQQISALKASIEDKETRLRKLREELRRTQKDSDTSICSTSSSSPQYPLTCGGGSGIVQSTAMLMLQSQNAALKREIGQYKKKLNQLSRNISSREDEVKKLKDQSPETPITLLSALHSDEVLSHSDTDPYRSTLLSPPRKSEIPTSHIASQAKTAIREDNPRLLSKIEVCKPQPMSPNKMERRSTPAMSPDKSRLHGKRPFSPLKTDGPLLSTLTESPCKKHNMLEKVDSPKDKFFDARSKSLPYCPNKFFDNSTLGTLPDTIFSADSAINDWWERTGKTEKPNDCKQS